MIRIGLLFFMSLLISGPALAQNLSDFLWKNRVIVVFADTLEDPAYKEQILLLSADEEALLDRDIVVLVDANPSDASSLRKHLRPKGFNLVLIGKDGTVKLRKPFPWSVRELSRTVDKMPMRQQEMRNR